MNNHSYVYIPADKLVELIKTSCPPDPICGLFRRCHTRKDCLNCWKSWLKDGE